MPTYWMIEKKSGHVQKEFMSISDLERWLKRNPTWDTLPSAPAIHSGAGMKKPDEGFRDVLRRIKKGSGRKNTINTF